MFTLYIYSNCTVLNGKCIFFESDREENFGHGIIKFQHT